MSASYAHRERAGSAASRWVRAVLCAGLLAAAFGVLLPGGAQAQQSSVTATATSADAASSTSSEDDLRRRLAAAEQRIRELERQLRQRDAAPSAASATASLAPTSAPDESVPPPAATTAPDPKLAQGAGLPPASSEPPEAAEPSRYAPLEAMEEKLPSWFPKVLGGQWTVINQNQAPFHSPYSGPNSLNQGGENKTSQTRGAYLGSQVTDNLQLYLDMEWFVGNGLHSGTGLGGYTNGDVIRAGSANLPRQPYVARAYARYLIPLTNETVQVARGQDQLPGHEPTEYLFVKGGDFAITDDFDTNRYANNTRTQFMNFALINNGAFDFAADTRGFSNGVTVGWVNPDWSFKLGSFQEPKTANGEALDFELSQAHGSQAELDVKPFANDTVIRFLAYANEARMGNYSQALQLAQQTGTTPDVAATDRAGRWKYGFGLNAEVPLADDGNTGLFFRAGWNDGHTETWAFTEIDKTLSFGGQLSGTHWGRDNDWWAVGTAINGLSAEHKAYLAAGGSGFMIGDGKLNYAPETILETYYSFAINDYLRLSPDDQFIVNPAYNADRGPVNVASIRARAAF